jgi:D-alanine-D-alanine ligase-like ATP-grasp enzyme
MKDMWREAGIRTPDYFAIRRGNGGRLIGLESIERAVSFPYIVKPAAEGNSRGIVAENVVFDAGKLRARILAMAEQFDSLLIERFLGFSEDKREFTVAQIGSGKSRIIAPAEIRNRNQRTPFLVTTIDKEENLAVAEPVLDARLSEPLVRFASAAFDVAGIADYGRCDVIFADGELHAIEINGQPMLPDPWFDACCGGAGLAPSQYPLAVVFSSIVRQAPMEFAHPPKPTSAMLRKLPEPILRSLGAAQLIREERDAFHAAR